MDRCGDKKQLETKKKPGVNSAPLDKKTNSIRPSTASQSGACAQQSTWVFNSAKTKINSNAWLKNESKLSISKEILLPLANSLKINLASAKSISPVSALFTTRIFSKTYIVAGSTDQQAIQPGFFAKSSPNSDKKNGKNSSVSVKRVIFFCSKIFFINKNSLFFKYDE